MLFCNHRLVYGAGERTRTVTRTELTSWDFKSQVSTNSTTPALWRCHTLPLNLTWDRRDDAGAVTMAT